MKNKLLNTFVAFSIAISFVLLIDISNTLIQSDDENEPPKNNVIITEDSIFFDYYKASELKNSDIKYVPYKY